MRRRYGLAVLMNPTHFRDLCKGAEEAAANMVFVLDVDAGFRVGGRECDRYPIVTRPCPQRLEHADGLLILAVPVIGEPQFPLRDK